MGFIDTHFLLKPEEYYKFRSPKPEPMPGAYLVQRPPFIDFIKVTRPDGSSRSFFMRNASTSKKLSDIGIPKDKQETLINHVMNFQSAYIRVDHAESWGSPPNTD